MPPRLGVAASGCDAEAAGPDAAIFVVEKVGADGESPRTSVDLRGLGSFGGRERGVAQIAALAAGAGLRVAAVHPAGDSGLFAKALIQPRAPRFQLAKTSFSATPDSPCRFSQGRARPRRPA